MNTVRISLAASLALLLTLTGCGRSNSCKPSPAHALPPSPLVSSCEPGQPGGRFVMAAPASPKTFNPLLISDNASDAIVRLLFSSLVCLNMVTQEPGPGLAESWSVEADQKTWTFKLRPGVRWNDGAPLTAADVVFTWNEVMYNPESNPMTFDLFRINGKNFAVTQVDDATVRVVTPEIFAPFVEFFGSVPILPRHALQAAVKAKVFATAYSVNTRPDRIVGCGPYRVKEWRPGRFTLLERNPEYWVADRQGRRLPYFDEVMITVASGPGADAALFLNRRSDVYEVVRPEQYEQFKQATASGLFTLTELGLGTQRDFLWFNQNTGTNDAGKPIVDPAKLKWFRSKKFRQAISCAIDRERMVRELYGGRAEPAYSFVSLENLKWNNPNLPRYGFDPARARALLAEMGLQDRKSNGVLEDADGTPVEILLYSNAGNPLRERAATMIQEDLKKLGLKLICVPIDFRTLETRIGKTFDYEAALMGLAGGSIDPASQVNVLRSSEELHQWFPSQKTPATDWEARIDSLMDAQMHTLDFARRKQCFDEVQAILAEELPMIYTVSPSCCAAIRSDIANLRPSVLTPYHLTWNLEELHFKRQ